MIEFSTLQLRLWFSHGTKLQSTDIFLGGFDRSA